VRVPAAVIAADSKNQRRPAALPKPGARAAAQNAPSAAVTKSASAGSSVAKRAKPKTSGESASTSAAASPIAAPNIASPSAAVTATSATLASAAGRRTANSLGPMSFIASASAQ